MGDPGWFALWVLVPLGRAPVLRAGRWAPSSLLSPVFLPQLTFPSARASAGSQHRAGVLVNLQRMEAQKRSPKSFDFPCSNLSLAGGPGLLLQASGGLGCGHLGKTPGPQRRRAGWAGEAGRGRQWAGSEHLSDKVVLWLRAPARLPVPHSWCAGPAARPGLPLVPSLPTARSPDGGCPGWGTSTLGHSGSRCPRLPRECSAQHRPPSWAPTIQAVPPRPPRSTVPAPTRRL